MKIGLLLPSSSFYPYLGVDFYQGLKLLLDSENEIVERETNTASPTEIQQAARELILKENVDMLTGWIGYKSITALRPLIQQTQTPLIMCNAGELPLLKIDKSPFIIHCSLNIFNASYLATKWALCNFGTEYCSLVSFYESGYPFSYAAELAARKYKGKIKGIEISHREKNPDLKSNIDRLLENSPSFMLSAYSGWEAMDLIETIKNNPEFSNIPIVANSMFSENQILKKSTIENIYSFNTWENLNKEKSKVLFEYFKNELKRELSIFGILGYESGMIIKHCLQNKWEPKSEIQPFLEDLKLNSPRAKLSFNTEFNNFDSDYFLCKTKAVKSNGRILNSVVEKVSIDKEDEFILHSLEEELSGWLNTYLCV